MAIRNLLTILLVAAAVVAVGADGVTVAKGACVESGKPIGFEERQGAVGVLIRIGGPGVPLLERRLSDSEREIRPRVADVFVKLGGIRPPLPSEPQPDESASRRTRSRRRDVRSCIIRRQKETCDE